MVQIDMVISGEIWGIHINEDSSKEGCNVLDNEIWANGDREEIRESLKMSFRYLVANERQHLIPGVVDRIMKVVGMRV